MLGLIASSLNIEYLIADILEESRNPAIEAYRAAHIANSSNSTPNSNSNPSKKGKNKKKGKKKASYNVKGQNYSAKSAEQASFMLGSYNLAIEEEEESDSSSDSRYKKHKDFKGRGLKTSSNNKAKYKDNQPRRRPRDPALYNSWLYNTGSTDHISNSKERFTTFTPNIGQLRPINTGNSPVSPAGIGSIILEVLSRKAPPTYTKLVLDNVLYLPNIHINIVSRAREPKALTSTGDLPRVLGEPVIEGNKVEKAISSPTLKEPNIGQRDYYNLLNLAKLYHVRLGHIGLRLLKKTSSITKGLPNFDKIKEADFHCSSCDRGKAVRRVSKAFIPDLPRVLDLIEGDTIKIRPRPYNRNPIVLLLVDRKINSTAITNKETTPFQALFDELEPGILYIPNLERYRAIEGELVDLDLDLEGAVSLDPSNLNTEKPISIEIGPSKLEPYESSSDKPIFAPKPIEVIVPNQPITNEPLNNSNLISEGDKMQLYYYKLLAKTSSYILSFVYKARKRVISKDSTPTTYKQVLKLPRDERSKWLEAITKEFIQLLELGVFKFLPRSLLPSNCKLITCRNVLKVKKDAKNRPIKYKSRLVARGFIQRILLAIGVFQNAKTCYFIVTYIDDCLFIGPNIGYITDLKKRLNKVYAIEDLGPAAYFLGWLSRSLNRPIKSYLNAAKNLFKYLNSTKDYSIYFSYNGNIVGDLGPKLSNSSNTTAKLSRDFHSKEGPRPQTTTSTTIVDSRNGKGSSRTSIINSSLVPIGFSDSDFTGDKATSKSTYGYLYKLAGRPISWKTKRATTIALSTLEAETNGIIEAIREVQWIIGLFSELYRPIDHPITLYRDNQGSITVANDPALHARTKHTLLKFRYIREQVKAKIVTIIYLNTNLLLGF
ncbi:hypothetical protein P8C59_003286 [Phyllachora maydis]|uniref:Retrovirus-related Pol polyprotein from transposon TNT 1-94-like beta-barrel domain-containing protein n=1 Tax=Phyllachora maydis TaxID=1825666 RepID=A0AAD9MD62_9PEZI|nr:hypothetical protein P8C59_003286 [Phyllachora maydis]